MASGFVKQRGLRWYAIYTVRDPATGKTKKKWEVAGDTKAEARRLLTERLGQVDKGTYVEPSKLTVAAFLVDEWLPAISNTRKPSTVAGYRRNITLHVLPTLGGTRLQDVTAGRLNVLYAHLVTEGRYDAAARAHGDPGLSPSTVGNVHAILHRAFHDAVRWGRLERNPATDAEPPRPESDDDEPLRTWTAEQLGVFLDAAADSRYLPAWMLAATTGLRRGELLGLRWDAIDLDAGRVRITRTLGAIEHKIVPGTPKTKKGRRTLTLDARSVAILRTWRAKRAEEKLLVGLGADDSEYVFSHPDHRYELDGGVIRSAWGCGPFHPERFSREFDRLVSKLDLPRIRFHDLRHTYATLGLEAGEHPRVMADRLGHANTSVTNDIYSHVTPKMDGDLAERQARRIFGDR